ncbi:MAG: 16S rRNA (cytidine1402-2'-O)-methyltransferase [Limisphaerales bacterium]|jgi:16S rRNA (cytidine1402-2'-O)-methyltransferase
MTDNMSVGSLFVVATPIGNLNDLSHRAEDVLKSVQIVAAEDTRRTAVLLDHIGHRAPELLSFHEHNEAGLTPRLIDRLQGGADIALVSDAGTPLINDPGFGLIAAARSAGIATVPVPGACSITAALSVCPLPCHPFKFVGFLAAKKGPRTTQIEQIIASSDATVFLESPKRIRTTLEIVGGLDSKRLLMVGRELTKKFESLYVGSPSEILALLDSDPRGEIVVVVASDDGIKNSQDENRVMRILLQELPPSQAAKLGASICGVKKSLMYDLAMSLTQE